MKVINGNNIDILKQYPDNYFDAIVTDPPYGLGKEPNAEALMKDWIEKGYHEISGTGFMGKEWDAFIPQPIFWKEVFRVLKHGGHVLSFFGTRTYDWGVMSMRFAGFEVRDCIQWLYGSGFPKSHNISKALDKMSGTLKVVGKGKAGKTALGQTSGYNHTNNPHEFDIVEPNSDFAKQWDGWGSALKPANEPIVLARKPLEKGLSIAENILKWGVGGINIDASRVGNEIRTMPIFSNDNKTDETTFNLNSSIQHHREETNQGRFPANIILTHHEDCECKGTKKVKAIKGGCKFESAFFKSGESNFTKDGGIGDADGNETIEDWNCHEDCPIKILDEQSGESKGTIRKPNGKPILNVENGWNDNSMIDNTTRGHNDKGGASRFFYVAKASKSERNKGLDDFEEKVIEGRDEGQDDRNVAYKPRPTPMANIHPTVKPIKLMQYLVRLITPPNGIVLDPFCGSGTTGVACKLEGVQFIGLEQDAEYCKIAEARIDNYTEESKKVKISINTNQPTLF